VRQTADAPNGLRWTVKRLIVPTGMRPMTRTDMLDVASPRRTVVHGMSHQRGEGAPVIDRAEKLGEARRPHSGPPVVGSGG
jgi:hypothetical protein